MLLPLAKFRPGVGDFVADKEGVFFCPKLVKAGDRIFNEFLGFGFVGDAGEVSCDAPGDVVSVIRVFIAIAGEIDVIDFPTE